MGKKFKTTYQRSFVGKIFLGMSWLYHAFVILSVVLGISVANGAFSQDLTAKEQQEFVAGSFFLMLLYPFGALFFGFLARATRGPAITEEIE